jgi:hypothetical protein
MADARAPGSGPLQLTEILCAEAKAIHNAELNPSTDVTKIYPQLAALNSAALCLSGGGIRSAAFCLGVIQAFASVSIKGEPAPRQVEDTLLGQFHYLSTVSGGGYIGSWLSLWTRRDPGGFWRNLTARPTSPDEEPKQLEWLRANSNYLTPKLGVTSADAWAGVALWLRNLSLNWLIILPVLIFVLLWMKWLLVAFAAAEDIKDINLVWPLLAAAAILSIFAVQAQLRNRPSAGTSVLRQPGFIVKVLAPSATSAFLLALALSTKGLVDIVGTWNRPHTLAVGAEWFAGLYAVGWLLAGRFRQGIRDFFAWTLAGGIVGVVAGYALFASNHTDNLASTLLFGLPIADGQIVMYFIYGVPAVLFAQLLGEMAFIGLTSYQPASDADREWFGRAAGWVIAIIIGWLAATMLSILGTHFILQGHHASITLSGVLSGAVTGLLGKSRLSPAQGIPKGIKRLGPAFILTIAALVFSAALIVGTSAALDQLLLHHSLLDSPLLNGHLEYAPSNGQELFWLGVGVVANFALGLIASLTVNINRFSLHALYRNRLIRAFLGATTKDREKSTNPFTNFSSDDNPLMASLWQEKTSWRPFHVINIALNIVSTKRLAWQERKAEPFTVTPLHCGSSCKAYRPSREYGGPDGITLGTAMAISGAAVSPNMGYHSSAGIGFLMALLNVRLGWWLGNPGIEGDHTYRKEGPRIAVKPLLLETFGLTTDDRSYIYLSDGGHFENLGIYEMVRRRCRYIVAVDAGCDLKYKFEDLGNAVRKISIDMDVRIEMQELEQLKPRPTEGIVGEAVYHAVGTITYPEDGVPPGILLYIKPGYHGTEAADIQSYAMANPDFPHQGTSDQWFSESQFESYRALGFEIACRLNKRAQSQVKSDREPTLPNLLAQLAGMT